VEFGVERRRDPMDSVTKKPRALQFCSGHGQVPEPSLARMGGGRPALTSRPSPDPLNGELQARLTHATWKRAGERGTLPMLKPASALSQVLITSAPVHRNQRHLHG